MVLMQENVPIGFNYILQDYHGEIQDYKQALDSYFDAFSLLLGITYINLRIFFKMDFIKENHPFS